MWVLCLTPTLSVEGKYLVEGLRTATDIEYFSINSTRASKRIFIYFNSTVLLTFHENVLFSPAARVWPTNLVTYFYLLKSL